MNDVAPGIREPLGPPGRSDVVARRRRDRGKGAVQDGVAHDDVIVVRGDQDAGVVSRHQIAVDTRSERTAGGDPRRAVVRAVVREDLALLARVDAVEAVERIDPLRDRPAVRTDRFDAILVVLGAHAVVQRAVARRQAEAVESVVEGGAALRPAAPAKIKTHRPAGL